MTALEFPPFSDYGPDVVAEAARRVPLEASQSALWSDIPYFRDNRAAHLELVAQERHDLRGTDGRTRSFSLARFAGSPVDALDALAAAMRARIIGWDQPFQAHVLTTDDFSALDDFQRDRLTELVTRVLNSPR